MNRSKEGKAFYSFLAPGASKLDAALVYVGLGLFVNPLKANSKEPATTHGFKDAVSRADLVRDIWEKNPAFNIGITLKPSCLVVFDEDPRNGSVETMRAFSNLQPDRPLPPTYTVATAGGGIHRYYRVSPDFYETHNLPQKLGEGIDLKTSGYVVAPPSVVNGNEYKPTNWLDSVRESIAPFPFAWVDCILANKQYSRYQSELTEWTSNEDWHVTQGDRDNKLTALGGLLRRYAFTQEEIEAMILHLEDRFESDPIEPWEKKIRRISSSVARYPPEKLGINDISLTIRGVTKKPLLDDRALYGPIGDYVRYIQPMSEAHPAAVMVQSMVMMGNIICGPDESTPSPGFIAEQRRHRTNLYCMLVGDSARGGKGDSGARAEALMRLVDPTWVIAEGIQTGERLLEKLADDEPTGEVAKINNQDVELKWKGGMRDRRLMVREQEFGRLLHAGYRKGSTLLDNYRILFDGEATAKETMGNQHHVSYSAVSVNAHVTPYDLERDMDDVELRNGFANRFLIIHTERTKILPNSKSLSKELLQGFADPLVDALEFAREEAPSIYKFSGEAWALWCDIYNELSGHRPQSPLVSDLLARDKPIIRRLSVIYAVLDLSPVIEVEHLEAAYYLWDYSRQSVDYIFGSKLGNKAQDTIIRKLTEHPSGLKRADISQIAFNRNMNAQQLDYHLETLLKAGLIQKRTESGKGRPAEIFFIPKGL